MTLLLAFAFLSGLVTVLSPCILPVLPIVLSSSVGGKSRPAGIILGLVLSFSLATLALSRLVAWLGLSASTIRWGAVVVIGVMGISMVMPGLHERIEALLSRLPGGEMEEQRGGWWSGVATGLSLGVLWAPCAGPILAAVIALAATQNVTPGAVAVVVAYAIGAGVPLLLLAYGGQALARRTSLLSRHSLKVQQSFGVVMILV
ncbi:MAG: cytochrome c biogenesis CcdA family protein, partial [Ardenticatenaceae bacterium]